MHSKYGVKIAALLLLIMGCGLVVGSLAALTAGLIWNGEANSAGCMRFIQAISTVGFFALPAMFFSALVHGNLFSFSKINKKITWKFTRTVLWLAIALLPLIALFGYLNEQIQLPETFTAIQEWMRAIESKTNELLKLLMNDARISVLLLNIVILGILPGICEEWLFRGTIQPLLQEKIKNKHLVIWITTLLFSAIHLQFAGFIPRLLLGGYLGYIAIWSGSLWLPILAHTLHNILSIVLNFFAIQQDVDTEHFDPLIIPEFWPVAIVSAFFAAYGIYRLQRMSAIKKLI
ncbi:MAG: CPBP family intramembrane metalloprotease [Bacteroidales bacterium]|nr:CPBP family intramembrane metalloprotease [Bacteroidales bacterium]